MSQHSKKFTRVAAFLIAFSIVATGCGNASSNEAKGNSSPDNLQTLIPSGTNAPAATIDPESDASATESPASDKPTAFKVADIVTKIKEDVELPMLFAMEGDYLKDLYGFDPNDLLSDGIFMGGMRNSSAELTIVQLKSDKDYDEVEKILTNRAERIKKTFESYLQDQHELAENYQIIRNGNYVLLSISDDQTGVAKTFNSFFK